MRIDNNHTIYEFQSSGKETSNDLLVDIHKSSTGRNHALLSPQSETNKDHEQIEDETNNYTQTDTPDNVLMSPLLLQIQI